MQTKMKQSQNLRGGWSQFCGLFDGCLFVCFDYRLAEKLFFPAGWNGQLRQSSNLDVICELIRKSIYSSYFLNLDPCLIKVPGREGCFFFPGMM